jgi:hypothetical protein
MSKQGWIRTGRDSNLGIVETRASDSEYAYGELTTYADAKAEAIKQLKDHIQPYLQRIEELQNDAFADSGKLPALQGWFRHDSGRVVVTAKTKKRAMELAEISRYEMENDWEKCDESWWYHLAYEEGVWCERIDENDAGTGVFFRPIAWEEANEIIVRRLHKYRIMPIDRLITIVGQEEVESGESSMGTPYRFTARIRNSGCPTEEICVEGVVDACLAGTSQQWASIYRELLQPQTIGWVKEGF